MRRLTTHATSEDAAKTPPGGWATMKRVAPYLWPAGEAWVKRRVVLALFLLLLSKIVSVYTPWLYKVSVDALTGQTSKDGALLFGAVGLTVAYGMARMGSVFFGEMRDWVFVRVGQRALRKLAY